MKHMGAWVGEWRGSGRGVAEKIVGEWLAVGIPYPINLMFCRSLLMSPTAKNLLICYPPYFDKLSRLLKNR